ncbi:MAG: hypothetical protein JRI72_13790 [Deltaproteobacteria bacterium]|nr:hypothetical protein [Deltaproteobacteria bacterium]
MFEEEDYKAYLSKYGVRDPNNPAHHYDYRAAWEAGVVPIQWKDLPEADKKEDIKQGRNIPPTAYMWPDKFKKQGHPFPPKSKLIDDAGIIGKNMLKGTKRAIGIGMGVLNSPVAFIWGSQAEQYRYPEQWKKLPKWKQALVATGAGFESAYRSAFKEGDWGTTYGQYYKGVTGKTIEEDMANSFKAMGVPDPERLASDLAPVAESLAEIVADPLITFGEASRIARLRIPKGFMGYMPKGLVESLNKLDKAEKLEVQERLLTALKQRKDYKATLDKLAKAQKGRRPPEITTKKIGRELPELTKKIKEGEKARELKPKPEFIGYMGGEKGTKAVPLYNVGKNAWSADTLKKKGIEIPKTPTFEEWSKKPPEKAKIAPTIEEKAKVIGKGALKLRTAGGAILGVEEDEEGNIRYSPTKAMAGVLAMAGGMKLQPKNVKRFADTLRKNPAWAKVVSGIGKEKKAFSMPGILSSINVKIFDRFSTLKGASQKAYKAARTFSSYKDQAMLKFMELQKALKPVRKDEFTFTSYVKAHRDLTRAERGLPNPGGVTLRDAKEAIKEIEAHWKSKGKDIKELKDTMELWNQWTHDHILAEALDNGIISKAAYDDILKNNKWYATYDVLDYSSVDINKIPISASTEWFSPANQKIIKSMTGTEKLIADPIEATIKKFTEAQATFAKNKVANILIDDPNMKYLIQPVARSKKEFAIMKNQGKNPVMTGTWNKKDFDVINRIKEGRVERYIVPKEIADAMKQVTPWQAPRIVQAYNSIFRAAATTLRLPFAIRNAFRDAFMAYCSSPVFKTKDVLYRFEKQWLKGAWEGIKFEFLKKPNLVEEYIKSGGGFGYAGAEAFETGIGKVAAKKMLFKKSPVKIGVEVIKSPMTLLEKINSVIELAPRIGTFDMGMKLGYTNKEAAMLARQATIDFNRGGTWAKAVNQFVPFLNARIQARVVLAEALKKDPKGTMAKMFVAITLPGAAAYTWNRLYHPELYDDIPKYIKDDNFCIIYGKEINEQGKVVPKYLAIPKGDAGKIAWNPIEFALEQEYRKDPKKILNFCINFLSDLSPVEFAPREEVKGFTAKVKSGAYRALGGLTPPMAKGPLEDWANLKFYQGTEIVPYYMGKTKPPELQYKDLTPETYKWLGKKIGFSPLVMQNYMANIIAGYGKEGLSPAAMLRGIKGSIIKTQGGEIERQAFIVIKDIEKGYLNVRAYSERTYKKWEKESCS